MDDDHNGESLDAAILRLAKLSPLEYDQIRNSEAKKLGVRPQTLDATIKGARKSNQSESSTFIEFEPWDEPVNGAELLDEIVGAFKRFIVTPNHAPEAAALWVLNTYVHDASYHSPILLITSPEKRCGKSTMLSLLYGLTNRPLLAANISSAVVYRAVEKWTPTLLIDEADTFLKQNDDMAGVINSGHAKPTAFVMRCDGDANEPKKFSTWCPKVIAGIGSQRDTLEDRSIAIPLRRKLDHEQVARLRLDRDNFNDIKRKCMRWAEDYYEKVKFFDPEIPKGLNDRAADNWTPLLSIADLCDWREKAILAVTGLNSVEDSKSIDILLLEDIRDIFRETGCERFSSQGICDQLAKMDDRPWSEWANGRAITTNKLALRLRPFGIQSGSIRMSDKISKGYYLKSFKDAFTRYLPNS